jgi:hypothetical protein
MSPGSESLDSSKGSNNLLPTSPSSVLDLTYVDPPPLELDFTAQSRRAEIEYETKHVGLAHVYSLGIIQRYMQRASVALTTKSQSYHAISLSRAQMPLVRNMNIEIVVHGGSPCWRYCVCHVATSDDKLFVYDKQRCEAVAARDCADKDYAIM